MRPLPAGFPPAFPAAAVLVAGAAAAITAAVVGVAPAGATPAAQHGGGAHHASYAATAKRVVRPVTRTGHAAAGYQVHNQTRYPIDCSSRLPSPGAVSRNIEECSPSAAYAVACWKAPAAHRALCTRNPASKKVYRLRYTGKFATTAPPKARDRAPLLVVLADGTRCSIRDGGAWGTLKGHPNLFGSYSCTRHGVAWASANAAHWGINESQPSWTLRTAGWHSRKLVTRHIRKAYFVGTAKG